MGRTAFVLVLLLAGAAAAGETITGRAEAIDGDSLCVGGPVVKFDCPKGVWEIRLAGIDAFEGRQTCTWADGSPWPCGVRARQALQQILDRGPVTCEGVGRSYDRLVAICRDGSGADVAAQLVRQGFALDVARYKPDYAGIEAEARRAKADAWAGRFDRPH